MPISDPELAALLIHFIGNIKPTAQRNVIVLFNHIEPFLHWRPEVEDKLQKTVSQYFRDDGSISEKDYKYKVRNLYQELTNNFIRGEEALKKGKAKAAEAAVTKEATEAAKSQPKAGPSRRTRKVAVEAAKLQPEAGPLRQPEAGPLRCTTACAMASKHEAKVGEREEWETKEEP